MKKITWFIMLMLLMLSGMEGSAQDEAGKYLSALRKRMNGIHDYSADAKIVVDIPFIKILPVTAQVFFKQKNKFRVKSKNLTLLPRQTYWQNLSFLDETATYTAFISGKEPLAGGKTLRIISIIPTLDTGDLILMKLWYEDVENLIYKSQLTTRSNGTVSTEYFYSGKTPNGLPEKLIFTIDVKKFKIPKGVATDLNKKSSGENTEKKQGRTGKIQVTLSNYKVNQGLSDAVFR